MVLYSNYFLLPMYILLINICLSPERYIQASTLANKQSEIDESLLDYDTLSEKNIQKPFKLRENTDNLLDSNFVNTNEAWKRVIHDLLMKNKVIGLLNSRERRDFEYADYVGNVLSAEEPTFFSVPEKRVYGKGFMGMRGKKANNGFHGVRGKKDLYNSKSANFLDDDSDIFGNKNNSKEETDFNIPFFEKYYYWRLNDISKRAPAGFMGMRGRRVPNGFFGLRGKRDFSGLKDLNLKRSALSKYIGVKGKKMLLISPPTPYFDIFDTRGKKELQYNLNFRNKFVGVRGKKTFDSTMSTKTLEQQKIDFPEEPTEENSKTKDNNN